MKIKLPNCETRYCFVLIIVNLKMIETSPDWWLLSVEQERDMITEKGKELLEEIARGNIEQHLGDVASDYESEEDAADAIYDEAYTLGFDALVDSGVDPKTAREVADRVARCYAQP
jgi:hypothetical protein